MQAWHSASVDQTPSLVDRSSKASEIKGTPIPNVGREVLRADILRFLRYEMHLDTVHLVSLVDGREQTVIIAPDGLQSFKVAVR